MYQLLCGEVLPETPSNAIHCSGIVLLANNIGHAAVHI